MSSVNGVINVYKEKGFTSHDVVAKLRGILKTKKIGHTGTLDPNAEGVLPVCIGNATKLCDLIMEKKKIYEAELVLGIETDTEDMTGTVIRKYEGDILITEEEIFSAVKSFVGEYDQIPPMFSAIKQNGKKLYELAREGIEVERKPRKVHISAITILDDSNLDKDNTFVMEVKCSKGTYIRTLCNDIGLRLGCGAAMQNLMRTRVGAFALDSAVKLSQVEEMRDNGTLEGIIQSPEYIFKDLDKIHVKDSCRALLENGNSFRKDNVVNEDPDEVNDTEFSEQMFTDGNMVRVYAEDDTFFGIYKYDARTRQFKVDKFFFEKN